MKDLKSTIDLDDNDEFENSGLEELSGNDRDSEESDNQMMMIRNILTRKNLILKNLILKIYQAHLILKAIKKLWQI